MDAPREAGWRLGRELISALEYHRSLKVSEQDKECVCLVAVEINEGVAQKARTFDSMLEATH